MNRNTSIAVTVGGATFYAARYIFDYKPRTSLVLAAIVGGLALYLVNSKPLPVRATQTP